MRCLHASGPGRLRSLKDEGPLGSSAHPCRAPASAVTLPTRREVTADGEPDSARKQRVRAPARRLECEMQDATQDPEKFGLAPQGIALLWERTAEDAGAIAGLLEEVCAQVAIKHLKVSIAQEWSFVLTTFQSASG